MSRNYSKLNVAFFAGFSMTLLAMGIWASTQISLQPSKASPRVNPLAKVNRIRKSAALDIVNTQVSNGFVKVSLRNVSNKSINGIQLSVNGGILQIEFLDADEPDHQKIPPGAIYEESFPITDSSKPVEVAVLAVTFDDKTSDGDTSLASEIFGTRLGVKKQLMRFRRLLADALNSPNADSIAIFDELKGQVNDLPDEDSADSGPMRMGQRQAKQQIIQEIDYVKRKLNQGGAMMIRSALSEIKDKHDRRIQSL
jgi:hypothetical protein